MLVFVFSKIQSHNNDMNFVGFNNNSMRLIANSSNFHISACVIFFLPLKVAFSHMVFVKVVYRALQQCCYVDYKQKNKSNKNIKIYMAFKLNIASKISQKVQGYQDINQKKKKNYHYHYYYCFVIFGYAFLSDTLTMSTHIFSIILNNLEMPSCASSNNIQSHLLFFL